jgi:CheY-like chemotaxis protein
MEETESRGTVVAFGDRGLGELHTLEGVPPSNRLGASRMMPGEKNNLIVVVEDETIVLMGYRMLFESWGYRVVAGTSLDEAMEQLSEGDAPSVIVADYRLKHGQTGVGAIRVIQSTYGDHIPAILITGDTAVDRLREAAGSGLPILHKPVNGPALQKLISEILETR